MRKLKKDVVSLVAYALGVSKAQIEDVYGYSSAFNDLCSNSNLCMARSCCIMRTNVLTTSCSINAQRYRNILHKNNSNSDKYIAAEMVFDNANTPNNFVNLHGQYELIEQIHELNDTIRVNLTEFFNLYKTQYANINVDYLVDFFVVDFDTYDEVSQFKTSILENMTLINKFPYKRICNIDISTVTGNILSNDSVFLKYLYESNGEKYAVEEIEDIKEVDSYDNFISKSQEPIIAFVDCENIDYAKILSYFKSLPPQYCSLFEQIVLVDDCEETTNSNWSTLQDIISIPVTHKKVDRVVENKSVNDFVIYLECFKLMSGNNKRLMLLASDSDYLPLITQFSDRTIIGYEDGKVSEIYLNKLASLGVPSFNVHDKCTNMDEVMEHLYNAKIVDYLNNLNIDYDNLCSGIAKSLYLNNMTKNQRDSLNDIVPKIRLRLVDGKINFYLTKEN